MHNTMGIPDARIRAVEWIVEVETADGLVRDERAVDRVCARLDASPGCSEYLFAYHPQRGSVALWLRVPANDAAAAARAAEAELSLALANGGAPVESAAAIVSVNVRRDPDAV